MISAINDQPVRFSVRSAFAETGLTCLPESRAALRRLTEPYFTIESVDELPDNWHVITGATPPASAVRQTVLAHGEDPVIYAIDEDSRQLFHLAPTEASWIVQSLLRSTRGIHRSAARQQGVVLVHGGLVRVNGLGIGLLGSRRAGKTSLIMASVLNGYGQLVCNDGVGLTAGDTGAVTGVGWPSSISVRLDTLDVLFGEARSKEIQSALTHPANATLSRLIENGDEPHGNALFYPAEYSDVLGTEIAHGSSVDVIVYPQLANPGESTQLTALPPVRNRSIPPNLILTEPNKHLNIVDSQPDPARLRSNLDAVADLPAFSFRYRFDAVRSAADQLASFLAEELGK